MLRQFCLIAGLLSGSLVFPAFAQNEIVFNLKELRLWVGECETHYNGYFNPIPFTSDYDMCTIPWDSGFQGGDVSGRLEGRQLYVYNVLEQIVEFLVAMEGFHRLEREARFCIQTYADEGMWGGGFDTCRMNYAPGRREEPGRMTLPKAIRAIEWRLTERSR